MPECCGCERGHRGGIGSMDLAPIGRLLGSRGVWPLRRGWGAASVIWSIFCWSLATMDITTTSDPIKRYTEFTPFYQNTSAIINEFSYIQNINSVYLDTHKEQHKCWAGLTWNTTTGWFDTYMRAWRSLSLPLDVVTTLSSGERVGQRGGLGHRAACPVVKPQWWYKTILEASLVTEDAKTISASVSKVASCDDYIITSLQAYLILWRSRVFPPALHAFRASTLHGFYPAFRSRDAIIPHQ